MKNIVAVAVILLMPAVAWAQATPSNDDAKAATVQADPGRPIPDPRGSLSGRGGPDAAGTEKTYSQTIGSRIYSEIGTPMGSQLPSNPQ